MSALRNYRRSLSERRESISEICQQDVKRVSEIPTSSSSSWQATSKGEGPKYYSSSDEDEDENDCQAKGAKPKEPQRRFSLDFIFARKNKTDCKKKKRSQSTTTPPEQAYSKGPSEGTTCV